MTGKSSDMSIADAARLIRQGQVVAFATETVYGLGADALNPLAVARIFEIKRRPRFDPLIVHVESIERAHSLTTRWPDRATLLAGQFWPGPLTIVFPKQNFVPDIVTAGMPTIAMRMPDHPLPLELIRHADTPIAAPSANRFGSVSPTTAQHVRDSLGDDIDCILDGGPCRAGVESTIISLIDDDEPVLLRPGAIPLEEIKQAIGRIRVATDNERLPDAPEAPGMLARHYSTRKPMVLVDPTDHDSIRDELERRSMEGCAVLCLGSHRAFAPIDEAVKVEVLSESDDLRETAANLFAAMRRLDAMDHVEWILACCVPDEGLGRAINDRLRRAAHAS